MLKKEHASGSSSLFQSVEKRARLSYSSSLFESVEEKNTRLWFLQPVSKCGRENPRLSNSYSLFQSVEEKTHASFILAACFKVLKKKRTSFYFLQPV